MLNKQIQPTRLISTARPGSIREPTPQCAALSAKAVVVAPVVQDLSKYSHQLGKPQCTNTVQQRMTGFLNDPWVKNVVFLICAKQQEQMKISVQINMKMQIKSEISAGIRMAANETVATEPLSGAR